MLPVNVRADEVAVIRDTQLELRTAAEATPREVTTDDFAVVGPRSDILLKDRDLTTPLLFMTLKPGEVIHIKATLSILSTKASQVCVSTFKNHIDPDRAKIDRDTFVAQAGDDPIAQQEAARMFDNYHIERSYHRDATGRADWFDLTVESIGVYPAVDLVKKAVQIYQEKITDLAKIPVLRQEEGWFRMEVPGETHTLGSLLHEITYSSQLVESVSVDIGHPLIPKLVIRFNTKTSTPEAIVDYFQRQASALCENVLNSL
jgi:DNA-directed RNA polymerase subunit L